MTSQDLFQKILQKESFLCVGLDSDITRIPKHLFEFEDPVFEFNKGIIDATRDLCVAYKPNTAFYEVNGSKGWSSLEKTLEYIGQDHFTIADAKRGDIGNTSNQYAKAFFESMNFDSITVAPYMGKDSVSPFLGFENKWVILLALTSNIGSEDFQFLRLESKDTLYNKVLEVSQEWAGPDQMMYVVGATHPEKFADLRKKIPEHFLLVPGVGAQGGDLEAISKFGMNDQCGLLVNSSRGIIFADDGVGFAEAARKSALKLQQQMSEILKSRF